MFFFWGLEADRLFHYLRISSKIKTLMKRENKKVENGNWKVEMKTSHLLSCTLS